MKCSKQPFPWVLGLVLCSVLLGRGIPAAAAEPGNAAHGKKLYLTYCFTCHGATGKGDGYAARFQRVTPRDLTNDAHMSIRTDQQLFDAISGGGPAFHGSMVMPYWRESLSEEQLLDLVAYLRTLHRKPPSGEPARGAELFARYCWTCHGKGGKGDGPIALAYQPRPRDLTDQTYTASRTDYDLYHAVSQGGPAVDRSAAMPAWGDVLTPQEIWNLVAYIRQLPRQP
jgi:cytochrome c oxidase cbb3-type subunit 3